MGQKERPFTGGLRRGKGMKRGKMKFQVKVKAAGPTLKWGFQRRGGASVAGQAAL